MYLRKFIKTAAATAIGFSFVLSASYADDADFLNKDAILGDPNAPIEMIEYASPTCGACQGFHTSILPLIKKKYIDTGKVKLVFRTYMLNGYDTAPAIMMRCVGEKKFFPFLSLLYKRRNFWFGQENFQKKAAADGIALDGTAMMKYSGEALVKMARMAGISKKKIEACRINPAVKDYILKVQKHGMDTFGIQGTPSILINGELIQGFQFDAIDKAITNELN